MNEETKKKVAMMKRAASCLFIAFVAMWVGLVVTIAIQAVIIHRQGNTIKELTTVCERLSQVFDEAEEGTATAIEPERQPKGITDL